MIFIGIDPGMSGAIAVIFPDGPVAVPFKDKTEDDIWDLIEQFSLMDSKGRKPFAMIERVHSMPRQGVSSTFKFGMNFGMLRMALAGNKIPREFITPQTWQKHLKCLSKGDKNVTKAAAQRLFPTMKITHAIADALLIAEYCRRMRK